MGLQNAHVLLSNVMGEHIAIGILDLGEVVVGGRHGGDKVWGCTTVAVLQSGGKLCKTGRKRLCRRAEEQRMYGDLAAIVLCSALRL